MKTVLTALTTAAIVILASGALNAAEPAAAKPASKIILPERKPPAPPPRAIQSSAPALPRLEEPSLSPRERTHLAEAVRAAGKREWSKAKSTAAASRNPLIVKIIDWAYLREPGPHANFTDRAAFITANPTWPSITEMRRRAEDTIDDTISTAALAPWFAANPPISTAGKVAYARTLKASGDITKAHTIAREAWVSGSFSREDESAFLREFASILTADDHWARLDYILYDEQTTAAERLLGKVSTDRAQVARARIALIRGRNVDNAVAAVPAALRNDTGLIYDRVKWRRARNDDNGARALIPAFPEGGARPDLWWRERNALARDALAGGLITEAYSLAKNHGSLDAVSVSEAEWLAGWIALRFLKDGETALPHFQKAYDSVQLPANIARGAYWTGRSMEALSRTDLAMEWYQRAATYVTTYYGQLALTRLKGAAVPQLPSDPAPTAEERARFNSRELTQALRALLEVDAKLYQRLFAQALAESSGFAADRQLTAELVHRFGRPDLGVVVARAAARDKISLVQYGYPVPGYAFPEAPEKPLILAIARQESNFDPAALSSAGARGLMQLMPTTARALARSAKLNYTQARLTTDPAYNLRLGSRYLAGLVDDFDGSYIMAAAGYNAGPSRPRQWARQFGDPRDPAVDPIDWVEQIPFSETRNYVQRVMENVMVYRAVLAGSPQVASSLEAELVRGLSSAK